jgi:hypothetical protein
MTLIWRQSFEAWDRLPDAIRESILMLAKAASK